MRLTRLIAVQFNKMESFALKHGIKFSNGKEPKTLSKYHLSLYGKMVKHFDWLVRERDALLDKEK